jgi:hypothetical protein
MVEEKEEKQIGVMVPIPLYDAIKAESDRQGQTMSGLVRVILWDWHEKLIHKTAEAVKETTISS